MPAESSHAISKLKARGPGQVPPEDFPTAIRLPGYDIGDMAHMGSHQQGNTLPSPKHETQIQVTP